MIKDTSTYAQTLILGRIENKQNYCFFLNSSYDVHGDTYGDYWDEPYGDYYDIDSENPR